MNNDLEQFSEEYLEELINSPADELTIALARIALSVKQAKPIGVFYQTAFYIKGQYKLFTIDEAKHSGLIRNGILNESYSYMYDTPQPAHTEQANPMKSPCEKCKGSGFMDSGGTQPWGEPISVECDCTTQQPAHTEQDGWIKCSERMPERKPDTSIEYLVYEEMNGRVQHDYWNVPEGKKACQAFWNHYGK